MIMPTPNSCSVAKRYIVVFYEHIFWLNGTSCIISRQPCLLYSKRA